MNRIRMSFFFSFLSLINCLPASSQLTQSSLSVPSGQNASSLQTILSPEDFLGYRPGRRFTPHYKIVNYFKQLAQAAPSQVKLEQYGSTYEGRPLLLAYIASPENLQRLESIRLNNLRLAGLSLDKIAPDEHAPAIIWLSYNVHGNEPASSEAAMKTIYELVNPSNPHTKEWLKNTVIIIDPCLNPDGRDHYVDWYAMTEGKDPDPDPQAREHNEPWPGGRTNHYNFDLNRDWAWQAQVETQERMKKYNDWLPQVHVDFHEQEYNRPYYFAPAAEPYHEVVTPWQREFQTLIGRNNAKYFDEHGWLYFTKETFDLFYPSYGDTYPTYNGAVGMTFEQGGIRAGLAIINEDGDTLTLADRLEHHFASGMSAIETASQNAARLVKEFHTYFTNARTKPAGEFRSYFIKADPYGDRLERLKSLLARNGIIWAPVGSGNFTGLDYYTGRIASFRAGAGDIAINMDQPKSNYIRVLFERNTRISDSATYDITAWSLPFVYGLQAYGLAAFVKLPSSADPVLNVSQPAPGASLLPARGQPVTRAGEYAAVVRWKGLNSAKFLAALLKKGVKIRYTEQSFQSGGQEFEKGSLIITHAGNGQPDTRLEAIITEAAGKTGAVVSSVASGFVDKGFDFGSGRVRFIHKPRVALLTGEGVSSEGAGEIWHFFEQELDYPVTRINAEQASGIHWKDYDVIILPDGYYKFLSDKNALEGIRNWVNQGGRLIALQGAVAQLAAKGDWGIRLKIQKEEMEEKKDEDKDSREDYTILHRYENRERDFLVNSVPGAIYRVELDNSHPLAIGYPDDYYTLKQDDNVYEFIKEGGWNVGVIKKENFISGFTGSKAKGKLKDGLVFGVQDMGKGQVVFLADDPLFRSFWENGKLLFCNAVFLVGQ